jgi:signal transduction histidine kinase
MEHLQPDDRERLRGCRQQMLDGRVETFEISYRFQHPTRGQRWLHHLGRATRRDAAGRALKTFGILRDLTEVKRGEDELRDLSRRLIQSHEEQRALLARELHDDVTQRLAVLAIAVGRAELALPEGTRLEPIRAVREEIVRLSEDVHSLAYQLHPSVLEELGLVEALRAECERQGRQGQVEILFDLGSPPADVGKDAALCLFRVAQEALHNVIHHSGARMAAVALRQLDEGTLLAVRDNGAGFDPAAPKTGRSLGLASMRERVQLVRGTLDIESAPGQGTAVIAWVPAEGGAR